MTDTNRGNRLKGKDLITIGIFSAIYFVINFIFMLISGFHPILWILMPGFIALFAGIPFLMMCAKICMLFTWYDRFPPSYLVDAGGILRADFWSGNA